MLLLQGMKKSIEGSFSFQERAAALVSETQKSLTLPSTSQKQSEQKNKLQGKKTEILLWTFKSKQTN